MWHPKIFGSIVSLLFSWQRTTSGSILWRCKMENGNLSFLSKHSMYVVNPNFPKKQNFENGLHAEFGSPVHITRGTYSRDSWCAYAKGQIKPKTDWRAVDSPKKMNERICFVCFFTLHGKQIKFVHSFFVRIYGSPICFSKLTDL